MTVALTATGLNTFDLTPPRRPNLDDFNGAGMSNGSNAPPDATYPDANFFNAAARLIVAIGATLPHTIVEFTNPAGVVALSAVTSACSAITLVSNVLATFIGAGVVAIDIPAALLPAAVAHPEIEQTDDTEIDRARVVLDPAPPVGKVRFLCKTKLGAAATNCNVKLKIW